MSGGAVAPRPWRLLRAEDGKLAGVCAGLAAAAAIDVTLVRIAFVISGLSGFGVIAYIVLAFVVPKQDSTAGDVLAAAPPDSVRWIRIALAIGAGIGALSLSDGFHFGDGDGFGLGIAFLAIGVAILWVRRRDSDHPIVWPWDSKATPATAGGTTMTTTTPLRPTPPAPWAAPTPGVPSSEPPLVVDPTTQQPTTQQPTTQQPTTQPTIQQPTTVLIPQHPDDRTDKRRRISGSTVVARVFGWLVVLAALPTAVAIAGVANAKALSIPLPGLFFALGAAAVINLIVWSSAGRHPAPVLGAVGAVVAVGIGVAAFSSWNGPIGEFTETPTSRAAVPAVYDMAIGHQVIDLRQLTVTGDPLKVAATQGAGRLEVIVPDGATIQLTSSVKGGVMYLFGEEIDGMSIDATRTNGTSETARYVLDLEMGYGRVDVCRASNVDDSGSTPICEG
jgi:phage shock protein PspC (stress-responsive transcriptional regulator)